MSKKWYYKEIEVSDEVYEKLKGKSSKKHGDCFKCPDEKKLY